MIITNFCFSSKMTCAFLLWEKNINYHILTFFLPENDNIFHIIDLIMFQGNRCESGITISGWRVY